MSEINYDALEKYAQSRAEKPKEDYSHWTNPATAAYYKEKAKERSKTPSYTPASWKYKSAYSSNSEVTACAGTCLGFIAGWFIYGLIIMLAWNGLAPVLFEGAKAIDLWLAMVLGAVLSVIF